MISAFTLYNIIRMNATTLDKVALRYRALFLDIDRDGIDMKSAQSPSAMAFATSLHQIGFYASEELLHAISMVNAERLADITKTMNRVMGVDLNWAPLVKGWNVPTGETPADHFITWIANIFADKADIEGTRLPCGHIIPEGTFPLERYNGCPFCGTPFAVSDVVYKGQASKLKELRLFTMTDLKHLLATLLASPTPLDGTQKDTLDMLLQELGLPDDVDITMKETAMLVVKLLAEQGKPEEASTLLQTPNDILRYLWFEKTGYLQIIEPRTLMAHARKLYSHIWEPLDNGADAARAMKEKLMLKYDRRSCKTVANWLNSLPMSSEQASENMNPKREMWVRMIRALRLGEYSRKKGYAHLADILDVFYKDTYPTWMGQLNKARLSNNSAEAIALLKQRPGLFSRCLFASMLRFGSKEVLAAFSEVADKLPARLLLSLGNAADTYFDPKATRLVRPITGNALRIEPNKLLALYSSEMRHEMVSGVDKIYRASMSRRFASQKTSSHTIYIEPSLYDIPVSVGDRTTTVQDTSCALMGTRFKVEGNHVRLFMQWGKGLHAQPLDMDLSARIELANGQTLECAFYNLTCDGAKHSGDIRSVPELVGTAEYIELSLPELENAGARFVMFTCNAYSNGALSPNLVVGWMDSAYPMTISESDGVAYDPSCVQHMVRISEGNLSKGLVFGVLDVGKREIVWLEMPFTAQTMKGADSLSVAALLHRLEKKLSVGELLLMKAKAQNLVQADKAADADEAYTYDWALNPSEVSLLLSGELNAKSNK